MPLGLTDVLVEQLRTLDVQEVGPAVLVSAAHARDLLGEGVRDRLGDQRLAASGRAVEQNALRRTQLVLAEQLGVQERQLDRVPDRLDLSVESADVVVVDVGNLFEDQFFDLALGDLLVGVGRAGLDQQRVTRAQRLRPQQVGEVDDPFLVGVPDDQSAVAALEQLLEHHDLARALITAGGDDVHRLVEHDFLAVLQLGGDNLRRHRDAQLAAGGEDVDGAVLEQLEEHAIAARRLRQSIDLLLERDHLVAGLAQRLGEALVALGQTGDPQLRLGKPVLQQTHMPG